MTVTFAVDGATCAASRFRAECDDLRSKSGVPCVVMAHGFGATRDCGLGAFAREFARAGMDVLAFDYRGFGESGGVPRQSVSIARQLADYRAAVTTARGLDGVDPGRIVLWGASLAGGHVLVTAARDQAVAATVSLVPMVDGLAAARHAAGHHRSGVLAKSALTAAKGGAVRLVGPPGSGAVLALPGQFEAYTAMAGPSWRNEIDPRALFEITRYRPVRQARGVRGPVLVQIADLDRMSPPQAAAKAAVAARAEVRHYPCDHFDVFPGNPWFEQAVKHQLLFLRRHLREIA
ncbi:alpha/beta hydrolase [Amycolatopsis sp. 195334CR]|uniref:alpha/beta hydrolase n=1 Tax=Amycolatopsis sp. 195334CR TaxID=2814588 RepID=UPI001A8F69C3|nr:alpha/beta hydrolase [Amycolatopsis sp. 195334CR]MBN6038950.1 alpha/beta hydrolase [Amycolatopsis sp. 195334CR]